MLHKAREIIHQHVSQEDKILVGLSGGADSIALAHLLYSLGYELVLVHINFHLRGKESDRDQAFVSQFIAQYIPKSTSYFEDVDTLQKAKSEGISIEMAARELRYTLFEQLRAKHRCKWIAVGHHANDQIETALLNLSRGTGGKGLTGMRLTNGAIIRPLLTTWKCELLDYLSSHQISYVTDSSNYDLTIKRNYIRHTLIPSFEMINPSFAQTLLESMDCLREEQEALDQGVNHFLQLHLNRDEMSVDLNHIETPYYLKRWLYSYGFTYRQTEDMVASWHNPKSISFNAPSSRVEIYRKKLYLITDNLPIYEPSPLSTTWQCKDIGYVIWRGAGEITLSLHQDYQYKCVTIRMGQKHDRFIPFGMKKGSKQLFRYLGEKGVPEYYRPYCPVLECDGEIIAVIPFEISEKARYHHKTDSIQIGFLTNNSPFGAIVARLARNMVRNR